MNRREAAAAGEKYFVTGRPCKYGHYSKRAVSDGSCVECRRPGSVTSLAVINTRGEIVSVSPERAEIQRSLIDLAQQKLNIETRKLELREAALAHRSLKENRQAAVKSKLIDVNLLVDPLDYEVVATMVWAAAFMRDPLLRREDVVTGRQLKDSVFVMKCFPEDKKQLLNLTGQMYQARNAVSSAELVSRVETIQRQLTAEVEAENNWPSHDPH